MRDPAPAARTAAPRLRVLVVDDSAVVRGLLTRWLEASGCAEVVGSAADGRAALRLARSARPDVALLDLDMPGLDGLAVLPLLLAARPGLSVLVVSTLSQRNAELSLRCLSLGAVDCLPKPSGLREIATGTSFREELLARLAGLASRHAAAPESPRPRAARRPGSLLPPRAILIGASTGGPRAVTEVLSGLGRVSRRLPILVVQHMPPLFTAVFAEHIRSETGLAAAEARDGEPLAAGRVYVAPGGRHLGLLSAEGRPAIRLDDGPALRHCRPALDILLSDSARVFPGAALAVVLTGMGSDGLDGARALVEAGGSVIVQDEATSTVWGMPGSIARAGLARDILPLGSVAAAVEAFALGKPA